MEDYFLSGNIRWAFDQPNECRFPEFYEADVRVTNGHALEIAMPAIRGNEAAIQHHVASVFPKHAVHCSQGKLSIKGRFDDAEDRENACNYRRLIWTALLQAALPDNHHNKNDGNKSYGSKNDDKKDYKNDDKRDKNEKNGEGGWTLVDLGRKEKAFLQTLEDRIVVHFCMAFQKAPSTKLKKHEEDKYGESEDFLLARNFAQELTDLRAKPTEGTAPPISFSALKPPVELVSCPFFTDHSFNPKEQDVLYFTWILLPMHLAEDKFGKTIKVVGNFAVYVRESVVQLRALLTRRLEQHFRESLKAAGSRLLKQEGELPS